MGEARVAGLRKVWIVNPECSSRVNQTRFEEAERMSVCSGRSNYNLAGSQHHGVQRQAIVAVATETGMITGDDVRRAIDSACAIQLRPGSEIVDRLPQDSSLTTGRDQ